MNHLINRMRSGLFLRRTAICLAMVAGLAAPAAAQTDDGASEIRIATEGANLEDPAALARIRREIAVAAAALCGSDGLASVYRNGGARCREAVIADAERQLDRRTRLSQR